jgi:hypothetical protein
MQSLLSARPSVSACTASCSAFFWETGKSHNQLSAKGAVRYGKLKAAAGKAEPDRVNTWLATWVVEPTKAQHCSVRLAKNA